MRAQTFQDAFSPQWIKTHRPNPTHDLLILHHIIPWQPIIERLAPFYHPHKGRTGHSLRILVATSILCRLRQRSDRKVSENMQENRSMQSFCPVPDHRLMTFVHPSTRCRFRKRLGTEGPVLIEEPVFEPLKRRSVIDADMLRMDTTVLASPIMYPTDVRLLSKAFDTMAALATAAKLDRGWDQPHVTQRWRAYNLPQKDRLVSLGAFSTLFVPAFVSFAAHLEHLPASPVRQRWSHLREGRSLLNAHTQQPWAGPSHMDQRLVSLDDLDTRPLKKGKSPPSTAWGPTLQMPCHRHGVRMTTDHCMGQPHDTPLAGPTWQRFRERRHAYPGTAVTALGFRRANNRKRNSQHIDHVLMGRSLEVDEAQPEAGRNARAATAGFLAVATPLRGFARSLSRGLQGALWWTRLGQGAYKVQTCLPLSRAEALEESTLLTLRLSSRAPAGAWAAVARPPNRDGMAR